MTILRNLTKRPISILGECASTGERQVVTIQPERVRSPRVMISHETFATVTVKGVIVNLRDRQYGEKLEHLPEEKPGVYLIVSKVVSDASGRDDLLSPDEFTNLGEGRSNLAQSLSRLSV